MHPSRAYEGRIFQRRILRPFQGQDANQYPNPWALPTAIETHAFGAKTTGHSRQRLCGFENLFRPRDHKKVLSHHSPAHRSRRIDQELSRTRNVFTARQLFGVNQIIAANCFEFWIREESKRVSSFLQHVLASILGRINTDADDTDSRLVKLIQIVLKTSQLEVTVPSPIASVKN
jgi:hypothetical protein